jgi:hypothetical protein
VSKPQVVLAHAIRKRSAAAAPKPLVILARLANVIAIAFATVVNPTRPRTPSRSPACILSLPLITASERMIRRGDFDSVIRIGNVPTLRFWRDLDTPICR